MDGEGRKVAVVKATVLGFKRPAQKDGEGGKDGEGDVARDERLKGWRRRFVVPEVKEPQGKGR